jgi:alkylhydroperoxidase family enzyme
MPWINVIQKQALDRLREVGYTDKDILDINLVTTYFNFVNRIAIGLGVEFSIRGN